MAYYKITMDSESNNSGGLSWSGVRVFQSVLFAMSFSLLVGLLHKAATVLPWYIKCLWHMHTPRRSVTQLARGGSSGSGPGARLKNQSKGAVLDALFRTVVLRYSERTGRDEDDVMREVTEHGGSPLDPGKQSKTEACFMECMYLI